MVIQSISRLSKCLNGIDKHITSHTARHSFSTNMLEKGARLELVSELLGHSSVKTTEIYAKVNSNVIDGHLKALRENDT